MANAKYWVAILYPENMVEDWQERISDLVQVPFSYCIHDKDCLEDSEEVRKVHVHLLLAFPNTTTYNHALSVFQELQSNCAICKKVINVRFMYNYLIHDTEDCRKKNKYLYDTSERVCGNNFDIGAFEQISVVDKHKMLDQLIDFIIDNQFTNLIDFTIGMHSVFDDSYQELIYGYHGLLEAYCRGNYLKMKS